VGRRHLFEWIAKTAKNRHDLIAIFGIAERRFTDTLGKSYKTATSSALPHHLGGCQAIMMQF
jgi:hypothetical protein